MKIVTNKHKNWDKTLKTFLDKAKKSIKDAALSVIDKNWKYWVFFPVPRHNMCKRTHTYSKADAESSKKPSKLLRLEVYKSASD